MAVAAPTGRSLIGHVSAALSARALAKGARQSKAAAFIADHVTTVAALAAADTGLWHLGPVAGWTAVAVSLVIAEFKIRG